MIIQNCVLSLACYLGLSRQPIITSTDKMAASSIFATVSEDDFVFKEGPLYPFVKLGHGKIFRLFTRHEYYSKFFHVHSKFETITFHVKIKMKFTH